MVFTPVFMQEMGIFIKMTSRVVESTINWIVAAWGVHIGVSTFMDAAQWLVLVLLKYWQRKSETKTKLAAFFLW